MTKEKIKIFEDTLTAELEALKNNPEKSINAEIESLKKEREKNFYVDIAKPNSDESVEDLALPKEGIYFNMPSADYFALPYFSRSLAQKVHFSGKEAEFSIKNPVEETEAMELGTAIHSMFLEPEDFAKTYVKAPSIFDPEYQEKIVDGKKIPAKKIIQTVEDLKPYLEMFGLKKSGKKEDLIDSVRGYLDPNKVVIWDDIKQNFEREVFMSGKKILSDKDFTNLANIREELAKCEQLPETIKNGRAEVVVIWKDRETGLMCKCRLDYVQPLACTDVKSYSIKDFNTPLLDQLRKKTIFSFYNFQYAIYKEALETAITAINLGDAKVYGEEDKEWLAEFLKNPVKQFFILYVRTAAPYQMQALELKPAEIEGAGENAYFSVAQNIWRSAIRKYAHFLKTGKWLGEKEIEILRDEHVPNVLWQQPNLE